MTRDIFFVSDYWLPKIGGMERSIQYLASGLRGRYAITLLTQATGSRTEEDVAGVRTIRFPISSAEGYYQDAFRHIAGSGNQRICHVFGFSFEWPSAQARFVTRIKRELNCPVILKVPTSGDATRYLGGEWAAGRDSVDRYVVLNPDIGKELESCGVTAAQIWECTNGVPTAHFTPGGETTKRECRRRWNLPENAFILGFCGRFVRRKRVDVLIDVVRSFPVDERPHLVLVGYEDETFGDGFPLHMHVGGTVHHLSPQADMRPVYHALDAYVTASEAEGMSNAVLEAMACGLPVAASRIGGHREMMVEGENGYLFSNDDPASVREVFGRLHRLFKNKQLHQLSDRSRVLAETRYDSGIVAWRYRMLYDALFKPRNPLSGDPA